MNIKQAKDSIKQTVSMYLKKNKLGDYCIPVVRQLPAFLLGAPGVGKTAIMEQIAQELGIALVSYSMTHHTRQSAIGLPFIKEREYEGETFEVTEYTMSEIIASVYETMNESGIKEGILFLDEINCVSETLYPSMLQFLQYKVFGRHKVPEGWVIVTAGNPPEFNRSVREFDVAVLDRLKVMEVEPDYSVFREYASVSRLHPAITDFLDMKRDYFYKIENSAKGRSYVTARGWEDLSEMICLIEDEGELADDELIGQYLKNEKVVREFGAYYELYNKYKREYQVAEILKGEAGDDVVERASAAAFDERLSLLSMLMDKVITDMRENIRTADVYSGVAPVLKTCEGLDAKEIRDRLDKAQSASRSRIKGLGRANSLSHEEEAKLKGTLILLDDLGKKSMSEGEPYELIKAEFNRLVGELRNESKLISDELHNLFVFCEKAFEGDNEMLILVTELTVNPHSSKFIARFGSPDYDRHQDELMVSDRTTDLQQEAKEILGML